MNALSAINNFMNAKISRISNDQNANVILAQLRRGLGKAPGEDPRLWDITLNGLSEDWFSNTGQPTHVEWAVYLALTLYAYHQQSKDIKKNNMHIDNVSLGVAVARLAEKPEDLDRVKRYLDRLVTSASVQEMQIHLRSVISLLRGKDIGLSYLQLSKDIYLFMDSHSRNNVQLKWAQDFYRGINNYEDKKQEESK